MHWGQTVFLGASLFGVGASSEVASPKADTDNYVIELKAAREYRVSHEGIVEIAVEAKGGYHINPQFPIRFKADDPPEGVTYVKPILKREDGTFDEKTGGFKVRFTPAKPGKYTLGGTVSVSFCSEKNCVMEKVPLDIEVSVK